MEIKKQLKEEMFDLECRNMRENLIFTNISQSADEDTEAVLLHFLSTKLNIRDEGIESVQRIETQTELDQCQV